MRRIRLYVVFAVLAAGCSAGDGSLVPVNGIVTWDNEPLDAATVTFYPEAEGQKTVGTARTGTDGKFVILETKGQRGLAPGKYKVTVSKMKLAGGGGPNEEPVGAVTDADIKNDLPAIYSNPSMTKLSYSVLGDGKPIEIKLSSKVK